MKLTICIVAFVLSVMPSLSFAQAPFLSAVAHDSTLVGTGTSSSPLGVAGAGTGALRAIDSADREVGFLMSSGNDIGTSAVIRHITSLSVWLQFEVNRSGFVARDLTLVYQTTDCTGQAYVAGPGTTGVGPVVVFPNALQQFAVVFSGNVYFGTTASTLTVNSLNSLASPGCSGLTPVTGLFSPLQQFPVTDLSVTPPFRLER